MHSAQVLGEYVFVLSLRGVEPETTVGFSAHSPTASSPKALCGFCGDVVDGVNTFVPLCTSSAGFAGVQQQLRLINQRYTTSDASGCKLLQRQRGATKILVRTRTSPEAAAKPGTNSLTLNRKNRTDER
ncbi:unnamed protein product [Pleuronectes platessa]|uniref:Uncharacterized protein n=1 Tax=Pleuronectes platessa TaxID=8262 RepID=A0A9N7YP52_PLEPL|nr:unnamed protein product [Pleuronectes platessa]